jgi:MFS family permease
MEQTESRAPAASRTTAAFPLTALAVTLAVQTLVSLALAVPSVLAPMASAELHQPAQDVGWLISAAYLAAMLSGLYGGGMSQRVGSVRMSQWALLAGGVALATFAAGWTPALLAAAAILGAGYGLTNPSSAEILSRHAPPQRRGLFFSIKQTGVPLGVALAGVSIPWIVGWAGWRAATCALAAPLLVAAVAIAPARARLESAPTPASARGRFAPIDTMRRRLLVPLRDVFAFAPTRRLSITSLFYALTQVCFLTFLVLLLTVEHGFSLALAAGLLSVSQLASVVGRVGWGHVSDRWIDSTRLLGLLGLAMAVGVALLGLAPRGTPWPVMSGLVLLCASTAVAWNGVYFSDLVRSVPPARVAEITGAMQFMTFTGGMGGSALFAGLVGAFGGYGRVYAALAVLPAIAGVVMLRAAAARSR